MTTFLIYAVTVIGSGIGFVTQTLVSGFWATTYSNDVFYFSVNTAFYFLSLGVGSLLSTKWRKPTLPLLFQITAGLCVWTGLAISILKLSIRYFDNAAFFPVFVVSVSGLFCGQLIPLALRLKLPRSRINLSSLFFFDYLAAIAFTLLFTFVLLIPNGYGKTSLWLAYGGLVALAGLLAAGRCFTPGAVIVLIASLLLPFPVYDRVTSYAKALQSKKEAVDGAYVIHNEQSHYQKIVFTEERGGNADFPGLPQHVLYLDGFVQFSSMNEQNYHACLANVPVAAAEFGGHPVRNALILGGGDGLVARNLLSLPRMQKITQVEIDPAMLRLAQNELKVRMYNLDSMRNPKVKLVVEDAFTWVRTAKEQYDLIVIDFPAPKNITLSRLFSAEFYRRVLRLLAPNGVMSIQAGPSFAPEDESMLTLSKVTASVKKTLVAVGAKPQVYVNSKDQEAFLLVPQNPSFDAGTFFRKVGMSPDRGTPHLCLWNPKWKSPKVAINTLNTLHLSSYMMEWFAEVDGPFFNYRGSHAVFLPE